MLKPKELLEELMHRYGDKVLRLAYSYLRDRHLAEDVAQEVFVRVFLSLERFQGKSSISTWIYQITVNLCRDLLRSQKHYHQGSPLEISPEAGHQGPSLEDTVLAQMEYRELWQAIFALPVAYREVIWLYYYEQLDLKELAQVLGISQSAAKLRLYRARQHLRKLLQEGDRPHEVPEATRPIASQPAR